MNRTSLVICLAVSMIATVGCASKNYVKSQTTPLIKKTNELDDLTAKNTPGVNAAAATIAIIATKPSSSIPPYPIGQACHSRAIIFGVVPEEIRA